MTDTNTTTAKPLPKLKHPVKREDVHPPLAEIIDQLVEPLTPWPDDQYIWRNRLYRDAIGLAKKHDVDEFTRYYLDTVNRLLGDTSGIYRIHDRLPPYAQMLTVLMAYTEFGRQKLIGEE